MIIQSHESCPQLAGNTARFEAVINPLLQRLKDFAKAIAPHAQHFEEDWQDALIDVWQQLHECPTGEEQKWAQQRVLCRFHNNHTARRHKEVSSKCCDLEEAKLSSSEDYATQICFSSEFERLENNVSCVRSAKIVHALRHLPEIDRKIFLLRLDNFTLDEVAKALKLTMSVVIYRFRQTILALKAAAR